MRKLYDNLKEEPLYKKDRSNCTVVATSLLCDISYPEAYQACKIIGKRIHGRGMDRVTIHCIIKQLGFELRQVPQHKPDGSGVTPKTVASILPNKGRFLLQFNNHVAAFIDGVLEDHTAGGMKRIIAINEVIEL